MPVKKETLNDKLGYIQTNLKVEKGRKNSFGNYMYRNLEDIFQGLKPLLKETGCFVTVSDEIKEINGSNYICATATIHSVDSNESFSVTGYAREAVTKKGMDDSQITGATSSYARKYAFNGLFAIDDTADADSMDNTEHHAGTLSKQEVMELLSAAGDIDEKTYEMIAEKIDNRDINRSNFKVSLDKLKGMRNK
jgi:hypothetical protein